ncbi:MAG TPA: hypothetical protein VFX03_04060, partial [Thermomicrobiales bacterium]|nr:hypothetical protein [Thermomicrobiales bacterium]
MAAQFFPVPLFETNDRKGTGVKYVFVAAAMTAALVSAGRTSRAQQPGAIENYFASSEARPAARSAAIAPSADRADPGGRQFGPGDPSGLMSYQYGRAAYAGYAAAPAGAG